MMESTMTNTMANTMTNTMANTMTVAISRGNMKIGRVSNVSLTPCASCKHDAPCKQGACYALKSYRQYPNVRKAWGGNWALAQADLSEYMMQIDEHLMSRSEQYFRWHVAGDIPSQEYLQGMKRIARTHESTRFLCFTKRHDLDYSNTPKNLAVIFSYWSGWGDESTAEQKKRPVAMVRDGKEDRIREDAYQCPGQCPGCMKCYYAKAGEQIVFDLH